MRTLWCALVVAVLVGLALPALGDEPPALTAATQVVAQRHAAIAGLLGFLKEGQVFQAQPAEAGQAVALLGELQAAEAVPLLLEHIDFRPGPMSMHMPSPQEYPCAVALAKIGCPALDGIVKLMAADDTARWLGGWVVIKVDGAPAALGRIQAALAAEIDPQRKQRLAAAVQFAQAMVSNPNPAMFAD